MRDKRISTIGIMFDAPAKSSAEWPTLEEVVHYSCDDAPNFSDWLAVAADPYRMRYFDDDSQAMDETNWDAIISHLPDTAETVNGNPDMSDEAKALGFGEYHDTFQTFLIIDPANEELISTMVELRSSLSDYPLLDENTYSEREYSAWLDYVSTGLRYDTIRELSSMLDEDTVEAIDEAWDDIAPEASQYLDYYYGFTGEHSPDFSECVIKVLATTLTKIGM